MTRKGILRAIFGLALVLIACLGLLAGLFAYAARSADRNAHEFCDSISVGSNISAATARTAAKKIFWSGGPEYSFYFFYPLGFDKAVCAVSVNKDEKVISKSVEVEID